MEHMSDIELGLEAGSQHLDALCLTETRVSKRKTAPFTIDRHRNSCGSIVF